jgi:hypothetical protein
MAGRLAFGAGWNFLDSLPFREFLGLRAPDGAKA